MFDPGLWLEEHGVCRAAAAQYAAGVVGSAMQDGDVELQDALEGIFHSGLTLGILIGERRTP